MTGLNSSVVNTMREEKRNRGKNTNYDKYSDEEEHFSEAKNFEEGVSVSDNKHQFTAGNLT